MIYLDDVIILSRNVEEHLDNLETVLSLLENAEITIKLSKCFFMQDSTEYLGNIFKPKKFSVAHKTTEASQKMMPPESKTQLPSFLRLCKVYWRIVKDFASVTALLKKQLKKTESKEFTLIDIQMESFNELKNWLTPPRILALPRDCKQYILETNANAEQLG